MVQIVAQGPFGPFNAQISLNELDSGVQAALELRRQHEANMRQSKELFAKSLFNLGEFNLASRQLGIQERGVQVSERREARLGQETEAKTKLLNEVLGAVEGDLGDNRINELFGGLPEDEKRRAITVFASGIAEGTPVGQALNNAFGTVNLERTTRAGARAAGEALQAEAFESAFNALRQTANARLSGIVAQRGEATDPDITPTEAIEREATFRASFPKSKTLDEAIEKFDFIALEDLRNNIRTDEGISAESKATLLSAVATVVESLIKDSALKGITFEKGEEPDLLAPGFTPAELRQQMAAARRLMQGLNIKPEEARSFEAKAFDRLLIRLEAANAAEQEE